MVHCTIIWSISLRFRKRIDVVVELLVSLIGRSDLKLILNNVKSHRTSMQTKFKYKFIEKCDIVESCALYYRDEATNII